jgi:hypothetical protein
MLQKSNEQFEPVCQSVFPIGRNISRRTQKGWQKSGQRTLNLGKFPKRFKRAGKSELPTTFLGEFSKKKPVNI